MRGMTGTIADMYRRPEKVLAACDKILELTLKRPLPKPSPLGHMRYFMTNTRGSDDFLSPKHFERFYWPTFKTLVMTLIERGAIDADPPARRRPSSLAGGRRASPASSGR